MSSNEAGLQSFGTHFLVFSSVVGLLMFMSTFKLCKPISHCCVPGQLTYTHSCMSLLSEFNDLVFLHFILSLLFRFPFLLAVLI